MLANRDSGSFGDGWELSKRVAGSFTSLDSNTADPYVAGNKVQLQVAGSTLTGYRSWSQRTSQTDTAITSSLRGGLRIGNSTNLADTEADNFVCGDGSLPPETTPEPGGQIENHPFEDHGVTKQIVQGRAYW